MLKNNGKTREEFAQYLKLVLIPDMKKAGYEMMAQDFTESLFWIENKEPDTIVVNLIDPKFMKLIDLIGDELFKIQDHRQKEYSRSEILNFALQTYAMIRWPLLMQKAGL
jgi:hypothetical protein